MIINLNLSRLDIPRCLKSDEDLWNKLSASAKKAKGGMDILKYSLPGFIL